MNIQNINKSIYLNKLELGENPKAYERVGAIWNSFQENPSFELLEQLGVFQEDDEGKKQLCEIAKRSLGEEIKIVADPDNTGLFFLSNGDEKFAVFKVGEKRTRMELLVRKIAVLAGLERHVVPGMMCCIVYPEKIKEELLIELWNGKMRVCKGKATSPQVLTGILEPFLHGEEETTLAGMLNMTILSLIVGLRDGKSDGICGDCLLDTEDCMPERFILAKISGKTVAATHLPFLESDLAKEPISTDLLQGAMERIKKIWKPSFGQILVQEKVQLADLFSEKFEIGGEGRDEGGFPMEIDGLDQSKGLHPAAKVTALSDRLLSEKQLQACWERIERLQTVLQEKIDCCDPTTLIEFVCAFDPLYKAHYRNLERESYDRTPLPSVVGCVPVKSVSDPDMAEIRGVMTDMLALYDRNSSSTSPMCNPLIAKPVAKRLHSPGSPGLYPFAPFEEEKKFK